MHTLICGSIAYDTIMVFKDHFKNHILPEKIHILNVAFLVPDMRREFGPFHVVDTDMLMSMQLIGPGFFAVNFEAEGHLRLGLNYASHAVPDADMKRLLDHAAKRLRNLPTA